MTTVIADKPLKEIQFPIERLRLFALLVLSLFILFTFYLIRTRYNGKISKRQFFNFNPRSKALSEVEKIDLDPDSSEFFELFFNNHTKKMIRGNSTTKTIQI